MKLEELRMQVTSIAWDGPELTQIMDVVEAAVKNRNVRLQQDYLSPGDKSQDWLAGQLKESEREIDVAVKELFKLGL